VSKFARDALLSVVLFLAPRVANVVLFVLVGRQAGPAQAGIIALANTYLILATTCMRGLDELVVRQVSREPDHGGRYLVNFALVRLVCSLIIYGVLALAVRYVFSYSESVVVPVLLFSLSVVPDGLTFVAQAVLMGQRQFAAPAIVLAAVSAFKLAGAAIVLVMGQGLAVMAGIWLVGSWLGAAALLVVTLRRVGGLRRADLSNWYPIRANWRAALSFLMITTLLAFEAQTDTLVLSKYHSEVQIGWYNGATTIAYSLLVLSQAYRFAVYPLMARYALQSQEKLAELYRQSLRFIGIMALPMAAGLLVLGPELVRLVFGPQFAPAGPVLQILSLALLFIFLNEPNSRMMLVTDRQRQLSIFLVVSTTSIIILNIVLTPGFGATGAAFARAGSTLLFFLINYAYVASRLASVNIVKLLVYATLASVIMAMLVALTVSWPLLAVMSIGVTSYIILLLFMERGLYNQLSRAILLAIKPDRAA
jgi:O-antigen/teichoic acid export membrane protein